MENTAIWFVPEFEDENLSRDTLGLINEARNCAIKMSGQVEGCLIGHGVERYVCLIEQKGVDTLYLIQQELLAKYTLEAYSYVMSEMIKKHHPSIILFAASPKGNELAGRAAAKTNSNCVIQANDVNISDKYFSVTKSGYYDKVAIHHQFSRIKPLILSMHADTSTINTTNPAVSTRIIEENIDISSINVRAKSTGFIKGDPRKLQLEEADRVVSVGRGLRPEHMPLVIKLADLLGASLGGTRPAVDDGMVPFERQIGITGKTITPNLIVNVALSGAREFTAGIQHASLNLAINTDKNAPIFKIADVCAIGDAKEIIEHLINSLEKRNNETS